MKRYTLDELNKLLKEFNVIKYDRYGDKYYIFDIPLCKESEYGYVEVFAFYNTKQYEHEGEDYYLPTPFSTSFSKKEHYACGQGYSSLYWPDTKKYFKMTWPDQDKCEDMKEYLTKLQAYAEKVKKDHELKIKKSKVQEKVFEINEEDTVGLFNELAEKVNKQDKLNTISLEKVNDIYKFGDITFKNRPKLKCWDVSIPYNRDYFWRVTEFKDVFDVCNWWYSKPNLKWNYGKVK